MHRYFFHSFPRLRKDESRNDQLAKGTKIAKSLLNNGLLLTPENVNIPIIAPDDSIIDTYRAFQRRACFTELEPESLSTHAQTFGPFSLAYEISDLRQLGAMPIFYIPRENNKKYLSIFPLFVLGGVIDTARIIEQLVQIREHLSKAETVGLKSERVNISFNVFESTVIRTFIDILFHAANANATDTRMKLSALASSVYPTEDPKYNGMLHYYRQREWRILSSGLTLNGEPIYSQATPQQIQQLLDIDADFFSKILNFPNSEDGIGALTEDSIANRSHFLQRINDLDVVGLARYLVIPDDLVDETEIFSKYEARGIKVVKQSLFVTEDFQLSENPA